MAPKWQDQLKIASKCFSDGHGFRIPNPVELMDFDTDCNTVIEKMNFDARYIWLPIIGLIYLFVLTVINYTVMLIMNVGKAIYSNRYFHKKGHEERKTLLEITKTEWKKITPFSRLNLNEPQTTGGLMLQSMDPQCLEYYLKRQQSIAEVQRRASLRTLDDRELDLLEPIKSFP